jgi:thiosulfate dehydrogenase [quinone] large subunit
MVPVSEKASYTSWQTISLVALRMMIGWHFLYEGAIKLFDNEWSSTGYLLDSHGLFAGLFHMLASNHLVILIIDMLNIWGLILIGIGMILGLFSRLSIISGIILISLYYLSHPPLAEYEYLLPHEGNYLIVDKNLIEIFAMIILLVFPTSQIVGMDRLINKIKD